MRGQAQVRVREKEFPISSTPASLRVQQFKCHAISGSLQSSSPSTQGRAQHQTKTNLEHTDLNIGEALTKLNTLRIQVLSLLDPDILSIGHAGRGDQANSMSEAHLNLMISFFSLMTWWIESTLCKMAGTDDSRSLIQDALD